MNAAAIRRFLAAEDRFVRRTMLRAAVVLGTALYMAFNIWVYRVHLTPIYGYLGVIDLDPPRWAFAVGCLIGLIPSLVLPMKLARPSVIVQWFFYYVTFLPATFIAFLVLAHPPLEIVKLDLFLLSAFLLLHLLLRIPPVAVPRLRINGWMLFCLFAVLAYAYVAYSFGLSLRYVRFVDIYTVRADFQATREAVGRFPSYFIFWISNVIDPILVIRGLTRRRWTLVLLGVLGQLVIFSITAFKAAFFSWALIMGMYLLIRKAKPYFALRFVWAAAGAAAIFSLHKFTQALFMMRAMDTGVSTAWYFEFFSSHPHARLGDGVLARFVTYPYTLDVPHLIASVYLNNPALDANANLFADAFANFGHWGVIVATILWAATLWLYDSLSIGRGLHMTTLLLVVPCIAFTNCSLQTTLLTNGFALLLILLYLLPSDSAPDAPKRRGMRRWLALLGPPPPSAAGSLARPVP